VKKGVWIGLGVTALAAVGLYVRKQYQLSQKVCFKAMGYSIQQVTARGVILKVKLEIKNTDSLAIDVRGYSFDIYGNNVFMASIYSDEHFKLKPYGTNYVYASIAINPSDLVSNLSTVLVALSSWRDTIVKVDGKVKVSKFGLPFGVPINYSFPLREIREEESEGSTC